MISAHQPVRESELSTAAAAPNWSEKVKLIGGLVAVTVGVVAVAVIA